MMFHLHLYHICICPHDAAHINVHLAPSGPSKTIQRCVRVAGGYNRVCGKPCTSPIGYVQSLLHHVVHI